MLTRTSAPNFAFSASHLKEGRFPLYKVALKRLIKQGVLSTMSRLTGRHAIFLPYESRSEDSVLNLQTVYRVEGHILTIQLLEKGQGTLTATLLGYTGAFPTNRIWRSPVTEYEGPCELTFDIASGLVSMSCNQLGRAPLPGRRFCWEFVFEGKDGTSRERLTGHYLPASGRNIDSSYYQGENYLDHEAQSLDDHQQVLELLQHYGGTDPVLEVGCATGGLLGALKANGYESFGLDISDWAVTRANARLGSKHAWVCNAESDSLPEDLISEGPFHSLVLWAVFEHFRNPFQVLQKLTPFASPGAMLLINTTNADSLTHVLFGKEWEGYFDWTHHGVDKVSVRTLREWLPRMGWRIENLTTYLAWDVNADPTRATLRDWWTADARFRRLLVEGERGDFITCVAVKES